MKGIKFDFTGGSGMSPKTASVFSEKELEVIKILNDVFDQDRLEIAYLSHPPIIAFGAYNLTDKVSTTADMEKIREIFFDDINPKNMYAGVTSDVLSYGRQLMGNLNKIDPESGIVAFILKGHDLAVETKNELQRIGYQISEDKDGDPIDPEKGTIERSTTIFIGKVNGK